jgi:hypothetical protein
MEGSAVELANCAPRLELMEECSAAAAAAAIHLEITKFMESRAGLQNSRKYKSAKFRASEGPNHRVQLVLR